MRLDSLVCQRHLGLSTAWGAQHLSREAHRVYTTELLRSGMYLRGGELVLSSTLWRKEPADSAIFVDELVRGGAVALAAGTAMIGSLPADLIDACRSRDLVLLHVPDHVSFEEITEAVTEHNQFERDGELNNVAAIRHQLSTAIARDGLGAAFEIVFEATAIQAWLTDFAGRPRAGYGDLAPDARTGIAQWALDEPHTPAHRIIGGQALTLLPLEDRTRWVQSRAYLACIGDLRQWPLRTREVIDELVHHASVDLALREAHQGPQKAFLARIITELNEPEPSLPRVESMATASDLDPTATYRILIATADPPQMRPVAPLALLTAAAETLGVSPSVIEHGCQAVAILPTDRSDPALARWRAALDDESTWAQNGDISVGIGGAHTGIAGLRTSWDEATQSLTINGPAYTNSVRVGAIDEADTVDVLLASVPYQVRMAFHDSVLGPIISYDRTHASDLLRTLDAALTSDETVSELARHQHLHPNTLRYRLHRVEDLTGRSITNWRDRLELTTALRIHKLFKVP